MLKKLIYTTIIVYLLVIYGQNFFEFGSELRKDFYFIGMALSKSLFAFCIYKAHKHFATSFLLFMCFGDLFNEVFYQGGLSYFEIYTAIVGIIYLFAEKQVKKWLPSS